MLKLAALLLAPKNVNNCDKKQSNLLDTNAAWASKIVSK